MQFFFLFGPQGKSKSKCGEGRLKLSKSSLGGIWTRNQVVFEETWCHLVKALGQNVIFENVTKSFWFAKNILESILWNSPKTTWPPMLGWCHGSSSGRSGGCGCNAGVMVLLGWRWWGWRISDGDWEMMSSSMLFPGIKEKPIWLWDCFFFETWDCYFIHWNISFKPESNLWTFCIDDGSLPFFCWLTIFVFYTTPSPSYRLE